MNPPEPCCGIGEAWSADGATDADANVCEMNQTAPLCRGYRDEKVVGGR